MPGCTFVTNVYERTYRPTLAAGRLEQMVTMHRADFAERLLVINNVDDREDAALLAGAAVQRGALDRFVFVEDELPSALARCGLRLGALGHLRHYSDFAFVELCAARTDYLLHQDAEVDLSALFPWVAPALEQLATMPEALVVNPSWTPAAQVVLAESYARSGPYAIGQGFSDQLFLIRRAPLAAPIYGRRHWASLRYPMAPLGPIFEAWVDTYMRTRGVLRLTDLRVVYQHRSVEGASHRAPISLPEKVRRRFYPRLVPIGMRRSSVRGRAAADAYLRRIEAAAGVQSRASAGQRPGAMS